LKKKFAMIKMKKLIYL